MKKKYKITVFTATYNRANLLQNIYEDLKLQTFKDFEWLIVDDGSEDNTKIEVNKWINESSLNIKYIYKENGGRHSAINCGVKNASSELFVLLDSDDRILNISLEYINKIWEEKSKKEDIAGILTLCGDSNNNLIGSKFPIDRDEISFADVYYKYKVTGDKFTCFKTDILKRYPFPEDKNIKFIMESVVWHEIAKQYNMICKNKILQIVNYQPNGLSNTEYSFDKTNGLAYSYMMLINNKTHSVLKYPKVWFYNYIYLIAYSFLYKFDYLKKIKRLGSKICYIILIPIGYVLYRKINNYLENQK